MRASNAPPLLIHWQDCLPRLAFLYNPGESLMVAGMSDRPLVLVTNDDGIESFFLERLVLALAERFRIAIAAPLREQSWIGRAMSRHRAVALSRTTVAEHPAWAVDGTPSDCVNLALGHLLSERPDLVISGINIGHNVSIPLLYSSGTIAGALEGAHWGLPAVAVSQMVQPEHYAEVVASKGRVLPPELDAALTAAADNAAAFAERLEERDNPDFIVHNLNYPPGMRAGVELRSTTPARLQLGSLFTPGEKETYAFRYSTGRHSPGNGFSDLEAIEAGLASCSRLNFSAVGAS